MKLKWRDVEAGMTVDLGGDPYKIDKIKTKGKVAKVTATGRRGTFTREVKAKAEVSIARKAEPTRDSKRQPSGKVPTGGPRNDEQGTPRRWAEPGDAEYTKPPKKAKGGPWDKPADKAEKNVTKMLGATLVGATGNAAEGWYVPKPGADTLAAHLLLFHDVTLESNDYAAMVKLHDDQHARAKVAPFSPLHVNHWHSKERPEL
jgi:hypothetical protein